MSRTHHVQRDLQSLSEVNARAGVPAGFRRDEAADEPTRQILHPERVPVQDKGVQRGSREEDAVHLVRPQEEHRAFGALGLQGRGDREHRDNSHNGDHVRHRRSTHVRGGACIELRPGNGGAHEEVGEGVVRQLHSCKNPQILLVLRGALVPDANAKMQCNVCRASSAERPRDASVDAGDEAPGHVTDGTHCTRAQAPTGERSISKLRTATVARPPLTSLR